MNKKIKSLLIALIIISSAIYGYFQENGNVIGPMKTYVTSYGTVEFSFPAGWFENPEEHPYELQCFSNDESLTTGVFQFDKDDLADGFNPKQLLSIQVENLREKRENFKKVEDETTLSVDGKTITSVVYSGDRNGSKNYYKFSYIGFEENSDIHLIVLQTLHPSNWATAKSMLEKITSSARIKNSEQLRDR